MTAKLLAVLAAVLIIALPLVALRLMWLSRRPRLRPVPARRRWIYHPIDRERLRAFRPEQREDF